MLTLSWTFLLGKQKNFSFFLGMVMRWMLHIGGPGILGLALVIFLLVSCLLNFNVGGWLTSGDLDLNSCAQL